MSAVSCQLGGANLPLKCRMSWHVSDLSTHLANISSPNVYLPTYVLFPTYRVGTVSWFCVAVIAPCRRNPATVWHVAHKWLGGQWYESFSILSVIELSATHILLSSQIGWSIPILSVLGWWTPPSVWLRGLHSCLVWLDGQHQFAVHCNWVVKTFSVILSCSQCDLLLLLSIHAINHVSGWTQWESMSR